MINQALNINKPQEIKKAEELSDGEYAEINKDIDKILNDNKYNILDQDVDNNEEENEDDKIDYNLDFFSDSSISLDNLSDSSEKTFKSANCVTKNNMIKNNSNFNSFFNKEVSDTKKLNEDKPNISKKTNRDIDINLQNNNNRNNIFLPNTNNINNLNNVNNININSNFNNNIFQRNSMNNQFLKNNIDNININLNNTNKNLINMIQMNNSNNNILNYNLNNNPMNQMNNFQINQNPNINFQMINNNMNNNMNNNINNKMNNNINNNMNNNINLPNQNPNNLINNPSLYNINIINYNNNMNDNNIFTKEKKNNSALLSYPIISERGVPGLYNLDSPKNIINIENILRNRDKRTTLIIRNIPNKYTIALLLKELNINFENKFDIVYLPQDYINNSNLGFGFINFVNPLHLVLFYEEFINKKWNFFNSKKRCNLAYSKYQGKNELIKYILTKLGISNLDNNSENIKKSFYIDNNKNLRAPIEIPINYYTYFLSYHRFASCRVKDSKVFIVDKYYNI